MKWSDGVERSEEEETLLLARQAAFARAVAPHQTEAARLHLMNWFLRGQVPKVKAAAAS
jgi:hypothetical protein